MDCDKIIREYFKKHRSHFFQKYMHKPFSLITNAATHPGNSGWRDAFTTFDWVKIAEKSKNLAFRKYPA